MCRLAGLRQYPAALGNKQMLPVVGIDMAREQASDGSGETAVQPIDQQCFENCALKQEVLPSLPGCKIRLSGFRPQLTVPGCPSGRNQRWKPYQPRFLPSGNPAVGRSFPQPVATQVIAYSAGLVSLHGKAPGTASDGAGPASRPRFSPQSKSWIPPPRLEPCDN